MSARALRPEPPETRAVANFGRRRVRVTALWQICTAEPLFWPFLPFSPPLESVSYRKIVENAGSTPAASTITKANEIIALAQKTTRGDVSAATLERARLVENKLMLYQAKTGTPVFVPLPPHVAEKLRSIPPGLDPNPNYFFWSGNGLPKTFVANWQRAYRRLFSLANLHKPDGTPKHAHCNMFRDTFAVEMLLAGVPILLGHASVRVTEKHYSPWVRARYAGCGVGIDRGDRGATLGLAGCGWRFGTGGFGGFGTDWAGLGGLVAGETGLVAGDIDLVAGDTDLVTGCAGLAADLTAGCAGLVAGGVEFCAPVLVALGACWSSSPGNFSSSLPTMAARIKLTQMGSAAIAPVSFSPSDSRLS